MVWIDKNKVGVVAQLSTAFKQLPIFSRDKQATDPRAWILLPSILRPSSIAHCAPRLRQLQASPCLHGRFAIDGFWQGRTWESQKKEGRDGDAVELAGPPCA